MSGQTTTIRPTGLEAAPRELVERLRLPDAFLTRSDLAEVGLPRRAIDDVFRGCAIVSVPGYRRPLIRVSS